MALTEEELKKSLEVLKALNDAIEGGPWEKSLFLTGIGKKLNDIRARFIQDLDLEEILAKSTAAQTAAAQPLEDTESTEVYVSLYQAEGANINKWAAVVTSIAQLSINRPVYKNAEDANAAIRAKTYQTNDAYAAVKIRRADILKPVDGKVPLDRSGRELLVLREGAIRSANVTLFTHVSGQYRYANGGLIKIAGIEKSE